MIPVFFTHPVFENIYRFLLLEYCNTRKIILLKLVFIFYKKLKKDYC